MTTNTINKSDAAFYSDAVHYWSEVPATLDGMLGGFGYISQTDINSSKLLLKQLFHSKEPPGKSYALDCGAGIGRITKFLLAQFFDKVDLVEQNSAFLNQARGFLGTKLEKKIGQLYSTGLQDFQPEPNKYDVIWIQWVLGHLTDSDLIKFLKSCQKGLKPNGVIIVKENLTSGEAVEVDEQDSSVTRPYILYQKLFCNAGLKCYRQAKQNNFPKALFPVHMFVLKPSAKIEQNEIEAENRVNGRTINNDNGNEDNAVLVNNESTCVFKATTQIPDKSTENLES